MGAQLLHQPPTYYLASWTTSGGPAGVTAGVRFRPEVPGRRVVGEWSWYENEFQGTQPFRGLIVANLLLNNWDWKTSNNKVYELSSTAAPDRDGCMSARSGGVAGKTTFPRPS